MKKQKIQKASIDKYPIVECFNVLKNLWAQPDYTELIIEAPAYAKLTAFIHLIGDYEISGFGKIEKKKTWEKPHVTDFDILKQTVEGAYVESDEDAVMDFIRRTPADERGMWTLDWHSHVNMGVSPSGTDWTNYKDMLTARMGKQFPAIIVNKRGDISAYQIMSETKHPDIKMYVDKSELSEEELLKIYYECKEKVENLCTKKEKVVTYQYNNNYWNKPKGGVWENDNKNNWYKSGKVGFGKKYQPADKTKHWWEEDEDTDLVYEDTDDDEFGYYCSECGDPLRTADELYLGVCEKCFDKVN